MQKGFSLAEMLLVSLLAGLLLLAVSQAIITLVRMQADQSALLRLAENAMLTQLVLKKELSAASEILYLGAATHQHLNKTSESNSLEANNLSNEIKFNQFKNSDWLLFYTATPKESNALKCNNKYVIFHIDKKENAYGLGYKYYETNNKGIITKEIDETAAVVEKTSDTSRSDTLTSQLELLRFRYFYEPEQRWLTSEALLNTGFIENNLIKKDLIKKIQFAFIIATSQPVKKTNPSSFKLWNQDIILPKDGLYRELITAIINLKGAECLE